MALIKNLELNLLKIKTIIEFDNVTLVYGNRIILDNISFKINEGQIFGIKVQMVLENQQYLI